MAQPRVQANQEYSPKNNGLRGITPGPLELQPKASDTRGILWRRPSVYCPIVNPLVDKTQQSVTRKTRAVGPPIVGCVLGYLDFHDVFVTFVTQP